MEICFPYSPADITKVQLTHFGILNHDEIRQMWNVQVDFIETAEEGTPTADGFSLVASSMHG